MNTPIESSLADLWKQLAKAEQKLAEATKELRIAERKEERASYVVSALREEIAMEQLRRWGSEPDLAELMASNGKSTMAFYQALGAVAESKGFGIGGKWADTNQTVLGFGLNRSEIGAVERVAEGIRYFAPAMKTIKGGWVRFAVSHRESESCAWELRYSMKRGAAQLVRQVYCHEDQVLDFKSLNEALSHVEQHLWCENVIDALPVAALEQ